MTRPQPSRAERLRRHAAAFKLALQLGITPREAEQELDRRAARARWEQTRARLAAKRHPPRPPDPAPDPGPETPAAFWWQRD